MTRDEIISSMGWPALANHIPDDDDLICRIERIVEQATADLRAEISENESVINVWRGRTQRTEAEREKARTENAALLAQVNAFYLGTPDSRLLAMTKERDAAQAELSSANRECEIRNERELVYLARAQTAEAELARLTTLRPVSEWKEGDVVFWELYGPAGYSRWRHSDAFHASHWTPLPGVKEAKP